LADKDHALGSWKVDIIIDCRDLTSVGILYIRLM